MFSSLSESGFIPTIFFQEGQVMPFFFVLISFREWLHSYIEKSSSQDSQIVQVFSSLSESGFIPTTIIIGYEDSNLVYVLISFREWLHSYQRKFQMKLFQKLNVLISFREWLHSYSIRGGLTTAGHGCCSHLFQRVASFLHRNKIQLQV